MATKQTIRNPVEWVADEARAVGSALKHAEENLLHPADKEVTQKLAIHRIEIADLGEVLAKGFTDLGANRTDVAFIGVIYPIAGLVLWRFAFGYDLLPLLFPLISGFTLIGPIAAIGLYELSRRREQGLEVRWVHAFDVFRAPAFGTILVLGLVLLGIFLLWIAAAYVIYLATLGPEPPASMGAFLTDVFTTGAGWAMIIVGNLVGCLFAIAALTVSVVSFPLLLDRNVRLDTAILTSVRAVKANPVPMAVWGLIVAGGLLLGALPALLGLIIVMPVLGHATWHLYRKVVES